VEAGDYLLC